METLRLSMFGHPVDFVGCSEVADGFRSILRGWDIAAMPFDPAVEPILRFEKRSHGYHWDAPWIEDKTRRIEDPSVSVMDAVCDFHYEFIDWYVALNPDHFCLHTAAIRFGGKAALFPCVQKAGKSTLSLQLAQRGHRMLGDDVVALTPHGDRAVALGLLPRMRLPLPAAKLTPELLDYIAANGGLGDRHWQYVDLGEQVSPLGETMPVGAVVTLRRGVKGKPRLSEIPRSAAIRALIDRNFGRMRDPDAIFDRLRELAFSSQCLHLEYDRPLDAALLLERHFADW
jgi:hypothetical protein